MTLRPRQVVQWRTSGMDPAARSVCTPVIAAISRNGRRAYCTARCVNYDAVTRHRTARRA